MNDRLLIVACLIVGGFVATGRAGTAQQKFDKLFANKARHAARTPGSADDAKLADEFMEVAETLDGEADVKILLYQKAALFAAKDPASGETAIKAVDRLDELAPDRKSEWGVLRLGVLKTIYLKTRGSGRPKAGGAYLDQLVTLGRANISAGLISKGVLKYRQGLAVARICQKDRVEEILAEIRAASGLVLLGKRRDLYKAKLDRDPSDSVTRTKLIMLELLELDNPSAAAKLCNEDIDEMLRTYVPMAAGAKDKTADTACVELGQWYEKLLTKAVSKTAKANAMDRARAWYAQFLLVHETNDTARSGVLLAVKRLDEQEAKSRAKQAGPISSPRARGRAKNLLKMIDVKKHKVAGEWKFYKSGLGCEFGGRQIMAIPMTTSGGYDLTTTFTVVKGAETAVLIPVGSDGQAAVVIGAYIGKWSGIGWIDGAYVGSNSTSVECKGGRLPISLKKRTSLGVSVRFKGDTASIIVLLNGKRLTSWSGKPSSLTLQRGWSLKGRTFALGANVSQVVWHSAQLQLVGAARN